MSRLNDLVGKTFGRLIVINRAPNNKTGQAYWYCECECGSMKKVRGTHLTSGRVTSCGCLVKELKTTHGMHGTPEYKAYYNMIKRCEYEGDNRYADYGGRGIKVCTEWRNSFEKFLADMGARPSNRHSIDRIDVDGDYEPSNCRWATIEEQERNKRVRWDSSTGVRGVFLDKKTGKYIAQIYFDGRSKRIGTFDNLEDAETARKEVEEKYWRCNS